MDKCDCDMVQRSTGDGCEICNPSYAVEKYKETIADLEEEINGLEDELDALKEKIAIIVDVVKDEIEVEHLNKQEDK